MGVEILKKESFIDKVKKDLRKNKILYLMVLPVIIYFIVFNYAPMYGIQIAFRSYQVKKGITGSPWIGLEFFKRFFSAYDVGRIIGNTFTLSIYSLVVGFPIPIIFALGLNYLRNHRFKKVIQMISYAPYFISTVVLCGMVVLLTDKDIGVINLLMGLVGMEPIDFMTEPKWFKHLYTWSGVWQGMGWSSIIYVGALAGVDPEMHEAAIIDGASKIQRMRHIDVPSIKPTIIMLFILQMGGLANVGFEKAFLLTNNLNSSATNIVSVYTYKVGMLSAEYGYSTAIGLINTLVNVVLLVAANWTCRLIAKESLF